MHRLLFICLCLLFSTAVAKSQTILCGQILDHEEPLIGASVKVMQQGTFIRGTITDIEGNYRLQLDSGSYDVEVSYTGYHKHLEKLELLPEKPNLLNVVLSISKTFEGGCFFGWSPSLYDVSETSSGQTFTAAQLRHMY